MTLIEYLSSSKTTQKELAIALDVSPGLVSQWVTGRTVITAERAKEIERVTHKKVTRRELRPDVFDVAA